MRKSKASANFLVSISVKESSTVVLNTHRPIILGVANTGLPPDGRKPHRFFFFFLWENFLLFNLCLKAMTDPAPKTALVHTH